MSNLLCHVTNNEELVMEFWGSGNKKITLYPHSDFCLKIWGSKLDEMDEFLFSDGESVEGAFRWLNE